MRRGPNLPAAGAPFTHLNNNTDPPLSYDSEMPPPPPLNPDLKLKGTNASKVGGAVSIDGAEDGEGPLGGVTVPKRRGRPPGSKNKKSKVAA